MRNQLLNKSSTDSVLDKRIPTLLGIGLVMLTVLLTTAVMKNQTNLMSRASNSEDPQNIKITNLSDNSFTLTYQTDALTTGSVNYGKNKELGNTELDDLDKEKGDFSAKNLHSIMVKNLSPDTKYYLVIISGQNTFLDNGDPFEIITAPIIASDSASETTIKGKVVLPDGSIPGEAIAYLSTENSQLLSTTVQKDGKFNFSLKSLRTNDLSSYFNLNENSVLKLAISNNSLKSTVLFSANQTISLPTITLSNDYDFTHKSTLVATPSAQLTGFPPVKKVSKNLKPQIITPKKGQAFTDRKPQFRGTSLPNETVQITINSSEEIKAQVKADSNGNWTYQPPTSLAPGDHTITIQTRDSSGILTTLVQSFTVFAAETTPTPSVSPTFTPVPTRTPTPTLIPTLQPSPTSILIPTAIPTFMPTPTPFPTLAPINQSKGGLPPVGSAPVGLIIGGIIATITGIALFLFTRTVL